MAEIKQDNHDQWIEIVKTVLLYVIPIFAAIWKITDAWAKVQKDRLSESMKDAVRDVISPQLNQINDKMDEMKRVQQNDTTNLNKKIEDQSREFNNKVIELFKEIRK